MPDFANLPPVLAGPILRRVELASVSVWVAVAEARMVELGMWTDPVVTTSGSAFFATRPLPQLP
jgi:hypothetical protein